MIRVIHKECGKIAFYILKKWEVGDPITTSNVVLLNGEPPNIGTPVICQNCNHPILFDDTNVSQEHWTDWFIPKEEK
ncbi:MAG: hypothetical protein ACTSX1_03435 [Candidatus Heimdallarchaeaceae archaeon]